MYDFETDFIDLFGIRLPVGEGFTILGLDNFFKNVFVHGRRI